MQKLLIANRGEIAIRIARAADALGIETVAVFSDDDSDSRHVEAASESHRLDGRGAGPYLDADTLVRIARERGCDAVHPGYGFLSEQTAFADLVQRAGMTFVGPTPDQLSLFGDKTRARRAAIAAGVPVAAGSEGAIDIDGARAVLDKAGPSGAIMLKALAGGGGRGSRVVRAGDDLDDAFERCASEAKAAFGIGDLYVEEYIATARHIEVQIAGDGAGHVVALGDRDCSVQRRFQKLVEVAPAPGLPRETRERLHACALDLGSTVDYRNLGTIEFLVDVSDGSPGRFVFIEANARLQVEHTVTEEVFGVDLVRGQLLLADGANLDEAGLIARQEPEGFAVQMRVNMETISRDGTVRPSGGTITEYQPPSGPGVRVDDYGRSGYRPSPGFDSLLAKVVVHSPSTDFTAAAKRAHRAIREFRVTGIATNVGLLANVVHHTDFQTGAVSTTWFDDRTPELVPADEEVAESSRPRVNDHDPLTLFAYDAANRDAAEQVRHGSSPSASAVDVALDDDAIEVTAPMHGTVVSVDVAVGDTVAAGAQLAVIEAMKMEHLVVAPESGVVEQIQLDVFEVVDQNERVAVLRRTDVEAGDAAPTAAIDPDYIRPDLQEVIDRHRLTLDEHRAAAVERRHHAGYRMPRENIEQLVDDGSFTEYWPLVVARQHQRYDIETLRHTTPADGLVGGIGTINADLFGEEAAKAVVVSYDYTVLAGTQGSRNHYKQDRMYELAARFRLPVVLFGEGGGGRPGDDRVGPAVAIDTHTFTTFSGLSALVPMVAIVNGRTFAGNTALVAACDVIIATEASTLAMGGPAMIEGGGLGLYTPEEVGPMSFQVPNGVVDILVPDEKAAVESAKQYLGYFQGVRTDWVAPDQRPLRHVIPENRLRLYEMRDIITRLADEDSVLELRPSYGVGIITCFIRIEGRPVGVVANNPHHLAGALDSDGADKGARFMQLCDAFDIPILTLMDCPGIMVGPEHERTGLVRHSARMFNTGANLTVPLFNVIVRKAYGLGAQAMCGAGTLQGYFSIAWPSAEFAGMNIEGSVKLGYRKELAAIEDPEERRREFDRRVSAAYESARAVNAVAGGGVDDVIDPADTRHWIAASLKRVPRPEPRMAKKWPCIDPW